MKKMKIGVGKMKITQQQSQEISNKLLLAQSKGRYVLVNQVIYLTNLNHAKGQWKNGGSKIFFVYFFICNKKKLSMYELWRRLLYIDAVSSDSVQVLLSLCWWGPSSKGESYNQTFAIKDQLIKIGTSRLLIHNWSKRSSWIDYPITPVSVSKNTIG